MESIVVRRELVQRGGRRRCTVSRNATRKNRRVCVSIWAEWARSTRLKREGEVATLVNWVNPWHRDIACVDARAKHLETGHACATGLQVRRLSTGGRSMTRVKIFPLSMLLARPTFPSTTDSIRAGKDTFVSFHDELRFFLFNVSIFFFFFDWKNWKKSNERNWSYLQRFSPSIPHFLAPFP